MKNLFVLMALAGLAAFQVGCGDTAPAPAAKPAMTGPPGGMMPVPPGIAEANKKAQEDKAKDEETVVTDDSKPDDAAGVADDKPDEDAPKE